MKFSVAIIGSGSMGKWHTYAYDRLNEFYGGQFGIDKKLICSRNSEKLLQKNTGLGWKECTADWREAVCRADIDVIDICTPDYLHYDIAKEALRNGKHVLCEKPLVASLAEAEELCRLAAQTGAATATMFNYRYFPAINAMKKLIDAGKIGRIVHISASFHMDWKLGENVPFVWRFDKACSPQGILGDLGSHLVDLASFIGLKFQTVSGAAAILDKTHKNPSGIDVPATNYDTAIFTASFTNGALGGFETSRISGGRGKRGMVFEVHGTKGNIKYEFEHLNYLFLSVGGEYGEGGLYCRYPVGEIVHASYPWSEGGEFAQSDSFTLLIADFLHSTEGMQSSHPTFREGYEACRVLCAVEESIKTKSIIAL